jgi:hypothetical protein
MSGANGFPIPPNVSARVLIAKEGQTYEDVMREHGPSDKPTIVVNVEDMSRPKAPDGEV